MIETQKKFINYLNELKMELKEIDILDDISKTKIDVLKTEIEDTKLLIPVVGGFSAGKSSLLNSFLGEEILPVKITPETSLATELWFVPNDSDERIEAVKGDGLDFDKYDIDDIQTVTNNASLYKFIRIYLNNIQLQKMEPLVLVDMPGFNSPLDLHHQAITEYINKGVHYIVLISVEDGTITKSISRQLNDIKNYERDFSFFLSKTNLKSKDEVESVQKKLIEDIEDIFDEEKKVSLIDDNGGTVLDEIISIIKPDTLFKRLYTNKLKNNFDSIRELINTRIASLKRDNDKNNKAIKDLIQSLESLTSKRDNLIKDVNERYSDSNVGKIVENVGIELINSVDELTSSALTGGKDAISSVLSDIVRSSLVVNIKNTMHDIGNDIVDDLTFEIKSSTSENFAISDEMIKTLSDNSKLMLDNLNEGLKTILNDTDKGKTLYRIITTILAVTTGVVRPIIEILIIFFPDIIQSLFGNSQQKKQEENLRNQIIGTIIPNIKRKLRNELPPVLNQQIEKMIKSISNEFESKIDEIKATLEDEQRKKNEKSDEIEKTISNYNECLIKIKQLTNTAVFN